MTSRATLRAVSTIWVNMDEFMSGSVLSSPHRPACAGCAPGLPVWVLRAAGHGSIFPFCAVDADAGLRERLSVALWVANRDMPGHRSMAPILHGNEIFAAKKT